MKVNPNLIPNITQSWAPPFFQTYTHKRHFEPWNFKRRHSGDRGWPKLAQSWHPLRINSICHCQAIPVPWTLGLSAVEIPQLAAFKKLGVSNEQVPVQFEGLSKKKYSVGEFEKKLYLYFLHRNLGIFWRYEIVKLFFSDRNQIWEAQCRSKGLLAFLDHFLVALDANLQVKRKLVGKSVFISK